MHDLAGAPQGHAPLASGQVVDQCEAAVTFVEFLGNDQAGRQRAGTVANRDTHSIGGLAVDGDAKGGPASGVPNGVRHQFGDDRLGDEALTSARLVGDRLLEVRSLDSLSLLAVERKRPWEAVAAANAAWDLAEAYGGPKVRAVVSLRQARAQLAAGDQSAARRALSQAMAWHDRSDNDGDAPPWTAFAGQVEVDYATAAWHVETGQPACAIPFLRSAVRQLSPTYSRNAALYRARLAEVLMKAGEVEEACSEAVASAEAAQGITSARLGDRLHAVASWAAMIDTAASRDCVEQLRVLGVAAKKRRVT
ncbi:tetratricopeptide (TPR) repeat protein [Kitasatospora acidiphila]